MRQKVRHSSSHSTWPDTVSVPRMIYPVLASTPCFYAKDFESWKAVIRTLLQHGADVYAPVQQGFSCLDQFGYLCPVAPYGTPLDELSIYTIDPLESQELTNGWLQILASKGHDVSACLETESALHTGTMQLALLSHRTIGYDKESKLVFHLGARSGVSVLGLMD